MVPRALLLALLAALSGCVVAVADPAADPAANAPSLAPGGPTRLGLGEHAMEPHVAVRGNAVVVANMADVRLGLGQNPTTMIEVHRSADGGVTWTSELLPRSVFAAVDPLGRFTFSGDAVLAYGPSGELYLAGVAASGTIETFPAVGVCCFIGDLSVFVTRSDDDGATWSPVKLWRPGVGLTLAGILQDKEWVTVGPDGVVHFAWTEFTTVFHTTIRYVRSTDGGETWSAPLTLARTTVPDYDTYTGTTLAAPGDGKLYASYSIVEGNSAGAPGRQVAIVSDDNGLTFSAPVVIGPSRFPGFAQTLAHVQDPERAWIVVPDADQHAYAVETRDGGASWTAPIDLSPRAGPEPLAAGVALPGGRALVAWYDGGWPGGERVVAAVLQHGAVVGEAALGDAPIQPAERRREYFGVASDGASAWVAWIGGDAATGTWVEAQRIANP